MTTLVLADYRRDLEASPKPNPTDIYTLAQLRRDDPEKANQVADESRRAFERHAKESQKC